METEKTTKQRTVRKKTVLNEAQRYLLEISSCVKSKKELDDIKGLISEYYFRKEDKEKGPYDPDFVKKIQRSRASKGRVLKTQDLWK